MSSCLLVWLFQPRDFMKLFGIPALSNSLKCVCRNKCGYTLFVIPAFIATFFSPCMIVWLESRCPCGFGKTKSVSEPYGEALNHLRTIIAKSGLTQMVFTLPLLTMFIVRWLSSVQMQSCLLSVFNPPTLQPEP